MLTKEQILQAKDLPTETVFVPEWGGEVIVRTMSGTERDAFEKSIMDMSGKDAAVNLSNIRAKLCAKVLVDEKGERMFNDREIDLLGKKSASALDKIFFVAQRLNGLSDKDVKDLAKNSETDLSDNFTSN
jgi:hypothetical protein